MTRREVDQLSASAVKEWIETDEKGIRPLRRNCCEGCIDLADGAGVEEPDLQSHTPSYRFNFAFVILGIGRIDQHGHASRCGHQLTQEFQSFRRQLSTQKIDSRQVAAWSSKACNETELNRVGGNDEDDGNCRSCRLSYDHD